MLTCRRNIECIYYLEFKAFFQTPTFDNVLRAKKSKIRIFLLTVVGKIQRGKIREGTTLGMGSKKKKSPANSIWAGNSNSNFVFVSAFVIQNCK